MYIYYMHIATMYIYYYIIHKCFYNTCTFCKLLYTTSLNNVKQLKMSELKIVLKLKKIPITYI